MVARVELWRKLVLPQHFVPFEAGSDRLGPHFQMSKNTFVTSDGISLEYFTEIQTLRHVRYWRDYPHTDRCEAWFKGADGVERRWYTLPLDVQGRAGHRYRLCWARALTMQSYELVGAQNLGTATQRLASNTGLVASMFIPARYGRWTFWLSFIATATLILTRQSIVADWGWMTLLALPVVAGIAGFCASVVRNRRDPGKSFDQVVLAALGAS